MLRENKFLEGRRPGRALEYSKMATASNLNRALPPTTPAVSQQLSAPSRNAMLAPVLSLLLVVPCFWHPHIEAGDLGSHVYNAWLAELVPQGRAPGVYLVWQWNNVLFDLVLSYLSKAVGFVAAERITVSLCVLAFFWGVFALLRAV